MQRIIISMLLVVAVNTCFAHNQAIEISTLIKDNPYANIKVPEKIRDMMNEYCNLCIKSSERDKSCPRDLQLKIYARVDVLAKKEKQPLLYRKAMLYQQLNLYEKCYEAREKVDN